MLVIARTTFAALILFGLLVSGSLNGQGAFADDLEIKSGQQAYAEENYLKAAEFFREEHETKSSCLSKDYSSAFNAALSYEKANRPAEALAFFRLAELGWPRDGLVVDKVKSGFLSFEELSIISLLSALGFLFALRYRVFWASLLAALVLLFSFISELSRFVPCGTLGLNALAGPVGEASLFSGPSAVVVGEGAEVFSQNKPDSQLIEVIKAGEEIFTTYSGDDWVKVKLSGNRLGWINRSDLVFIP